MEPLDPIFYAVLFNNLEKLKFADTFITEAKERIDRNGLDSKVQIYILLSELSENAPARGLIPKATTFWENLVTDYHHRVASIYIPDVELHPVVDI